MVQPRRFVQRSLMPVDAATAFRWHERPGALQRFMPPWETHQIVRLPASLQPGQQAILKMKIGPFWKTWVAEHRRYQSGVEFQDVQLSGPFQSFDHTHRLIPGDNGTCWLEDEIDYVPPGGRLGQWLGDAFIQQTLQRAFRYRHSITAGDLAVHAQHRKASAMKVLVTGATGMVGSTLIPFLSTGGHETYRLMRSASQEPNDIPWDPARGEIAQSRLEGLDGVVHLAGENIAGRRWTTKVKQRLRDSRIEGTRLLCESLAKLKNPPKVVVCASAIGYYGDRGNESLTEESPAGSGFLPELCVEWEKACEPARAAGIRVVNLRIGVVLSLKGGALQQMKLPFQFGAGGVMGSGQQYWSWIALDDLIGAILHCLTHEPLQGPVNATAPNPATNYEFTKTLGAVLKRPTLVPLPAFAARLALGEMANDLLLASARVLPTRLQVTGFQFRYPTLEQALRHALGM